MVATREDFDCIRATIPSLAQVDTARADELYALFQATESGLQVNPTDFFRYRMFELTPEEQAEFITYQQYAQLCGRMNDPVLASGLFDRPAFYREYDEYLGRDWLLAVPEERSHFRELCERHRKLAYKTRAGASWRDFQIVTTRDSAYLWLDAMAERAVIEELVVQHEDLARLYPHAVNTLRIVTVVGLDGKARVLSAALRTGCGNRTIDSGEGFFAGVDLDTGVTVTGGATHILQSYDRHPDTDVEIRGFVVPCWDGLMARVVEAAEKHPELRIMNWDWACQRDGTWCILEGNFADGIGACQEAFGRGLRHEVYQALGLDLDA